MKKLLLIILIIIVVAFVVMQFFQPEKNIGTGDTNEDIFIMIQDVPVPVEENIRNACYDCHSNNTRYPWYGYISPVSWILDDHVQSGKSQLNFSQWGSYDRKKQINLLVDICEVTESRSMPLEGYVKLHEDARLSNEDIEEICHWADETGMALLRAK